MRIIRRSMLGDGVGAAGGAEWIACGDGLCWAKAVMKRAQASNAQTSRLLTVIDTPRGFAVRPGTGSGGAGAHHHRCLLHSARDLHAYALQLLRRGRALWPTVRIE